jgi:hypothetical protein
MDDYFGWITSGSGADTTYTYTDDDGSTLTIDAGGNVVNSTESTDVTEGGAQTYTDNDGSTLTIHADGTISTTEATDTGAGGAAGAGAPTGIEKLIADAAKALGLKSPAQLAALAGAAGSGLSALLGGTSSQRPTGYMGKIPSYTAVREQIPYADAEATRPGAAGRQYFTDVKYVSPTEAATAQAAAKQEDEGIATLQKPTEMAAGGLTALKSGRYLNGATDGMADEVPARIEDKQEARLSHGEFVVPADVVSHLGNGNSEAGAKRLYDMMAKLRKARTGTPQQGKKINPAKYLPA